MGIRERLMLDFEGKTLEYKDKKLYILKQFKYKNHVFLYGIDISTVNSENIEVAFLYRVRDDVFNHVEDEKLFKKLFDKVSGLCIADVIKKNIENAS